MKITYAEEKDIAAIATAEAACFPPAEAATEQEFVERIKYYSNHFWLLYDADKLIAFVDGFCHGRAGFDRYNVRKRLYAQRKRCMADDFRRQYPAGVPQTRLCL